MQWLHADAPSLAALLLQPEVPGVVGGLPVSLVRHGATVHVLLPSMHESMATHSQYRAAIVGPAAVLHSVMRGTPVSARLQLKAHRYLSELLDDAERAERSLSNR